MNHPEKEVNKGEIIYVALLAIIVSMDSILRACSPVSIHRCKIS